MAYSTNTLTGLIPVLYTALFDVAREQVGAIAAIQTNFDDKAAALDQTVRVPIAPVQTVSAYEPAQVVTVGSDRVGSYADVKITKSRHTKFQLNGEEERSLLAGGNTIGQELFQQSMVQSMRALCNEVEADICDLDDYAGYATGVGGTTPFASNLSELANALKLMRDVGAPPDDLHLVYNTDAWVNLVKLGVVTANVGSLSDSMAKTGQIPPLFGTQLHVSGQINSHTAGAGAADTGDIESGVAAIGATTIYATTGLTSANYLLGDVISFTTGSFEKYVVKSSDSSADTITLNCGLLKALVGAQHMVVEATSKHNLMVHKNAAVLVARPPAIDPNAIIETQLVTDPKSGLTFMVCRCPGDGLVTYRVHLAWGVKVVHPEFFHLFLG